jgi:hypothetical protein
VRWGTELAKANPEANLPNMAMTLNSWNVSVRSGRIAIFFGFVRVGRGIAHAVREFLRIREHVDVRSNLGRLLQFGFLD